MISRTRPTSAGFSLVEMLIATAITASVTALACALAIEAQAAWRADSTRVDLQQRTRVVADVLTRALLEAGAGPPGGPAQGPLIDVLAPILPRRIGATGADPPDLFRADAFTILRTLPETEHATLLLPAPAGAEVLDLAPSPSCMLPSCGFAAGSAVLLCDGAGSFDIFTVRGASGLTLDVAHRGPGSATAYPAGAAVLAVDLASYYTDPRARLLRVSNGHTSDLPITDDVVGVEVEYYGEVRPPVWLRPPAGGANCLYDADGAFRTALMPALAGGPALSRLDEAMLTDGPWCGAGSTQFDADLLRVRRVRVSVRLQAADPAVRGADPARFREPGTARRSAALVEDAVIRIDVAPRNLVGGW